MSRKKNRSGLNRLGKRADEIFSQAAPAEAPVPLAEPVKPENEGPSLLEFAPALAWTLWWQDMCHLKTQQMCRYWWD